MVPDGGRQSAAARVAGRLVACFLDGIEGSSLDRATAERRLAEASTCRDDGADRCTDELSW